jgi:anaerobic ribonucleoside-triphosphate reductase activating protein
VLGPGARAVVWFQGCSLRCPGCMAQTMNDDDAHEAWTPAALADRICRLAGIEGITLSGGDPFDQPPEALCAFTEAIRRHSDLTIMVFTGRTLAQLRRQLPPALAERLLATIDLLVDGPYVEELNDGSLWRGSSNQEIHFLTPRYAHLRPMVASSRSRGLEVSVRNGRELEITGIPPRGFLAGLTRRLDARGLLLDFSPNPKSDES